MANKWAALDLHQLWGRASDIKVLDEESAFTNLEVPLLTPLLKSGLCRGQIVEINGTRSSGKASICLHILAQAIACGEVCAIIDFDDNFHPGSAHSAGVLLERLVWVRCHKNAEHLLRAADLLLHAGGFGVVVLDLSEATTRILNRIPVSYWYRFRRAVEHTPTIFLVCAESSQVKSCSRYRLELKSKVFDWAEKAPFRLLRGLETTAILRKISIAQPQRLFLQTVP